MNAVRALLTLSLLLASAGAAAERERRIVFAGLERSYRLHVPPKPLPESPLVVVLHGGGGRGRGMERISGFDALADREGFLVAYPDGLGRNWYDGREGDFSEAHRTRRDDAGFIAAMIEDIGRGRRLDRRRIYATGLSNGAFFSHYLGATRSDLFAAIAPVAGGLADPFHRSFAPREPVSVLILQGTADPLIPYAGGAAAGRRGRLVSTEEAARLWRGADGCAGEPSFETLPDKDPADGCRATRRTWKGCRAGAEVSLISLEGAGHTWPDGPQYLPRRIVGSVCRDLDSGAIWEFFKAHPKRGRPASPLNR